MLGNVMLMCLLSFCPLYACIMHACMAWCDISFTPVLYLYFCLSAISLLLSFCHIVTSVFLLYRYFCLFAILLLLSFCHIVTSVPLAGWRLPQATLVWHSTSRPSQGTSTSTSSSLELWNFSITPCPCGSWTGKWHLRLQVCMVCLQQQQQEWQCCLVIPVGDWSWHSTSNIKAQPKTEL